MSNNSTLVTKRLLRDLWEFNAIDAQSVNKIMLAPSNVGEYPDVSSLSCLVHDLRLRLENCLDCTGRTPTDLAFELWLNIGLTIAGGRFVPMFSLPNENEPYKAGILSVASDIRKNSSSAGTPLPGRVANLFETHLKGKSSFHSWLLDLNTKLYENRESGLAVNSICLFAETGSNRVPSSEIIAKWGNQEHQRATGDFLIIIKERQDESIVEQINRQFKLIAGKVELKNPSDADQETYFQKVFFRPSPKPTDCDSHKEMIAEWVEYSFFWLVALGCDGFRRRHPNTIMAYSNRWFYPSDFKSAACDLIKLAENIEDLESQIKERRFGAAEAARSLLSHLGHDGKHEAKTIERILDTRWDGAPLAAKRFAASLAGRMSCYSRFALVSRKKEPRAVIRDLESDVSKTCGSISIEDLFYGEFDAIVARHLTEQSESKEFRVLFQSLFDHKPRTQFLQILRSQHVVLGYDGPQLRLPERVKEQDPILIACLRLIFSELLRNMVRHQWGARLFPPKQEDKREIELSASIEADFVQIEFKFAPFIQKDVDEDSGFVGLMSIMTALRACGGRANTTKIVGSPGVEVLFPEPTAGGGRTSFEIPSVAFLKQ